MEGSPIARHKGRLKKIIGETIKKDLDFNGLNIIYDQTLWCCLINVADPTLLGQGLVVVIVVVVV